MSWPERVGANARFAEAQRAREAEQRVQERLEADLARREADSIAEGILERFGVVQALKDVGKDVWKEGEIAQTRNKRGWVLVSYPVETIEGAHERYRREKDRSINAITLGSGSMGLAISVEFEKGDPAEPKLVLLDMAAPFRLNKLA